MDRIEFLKKVAAGGSLLLLAPGVFNACSKNSDITDPGGGSNGGGSLPIEIDLTNSAYSALGTVGGYAYSGNILIFRTDESTYKALTKVCTHQSCTVTYSYANNNIPCPCHGSLYTTEGVVIKGPAPQNLKKYNVTKSGNILTIS